MTATARDRRDRLRAMLADLKMPGALEAVDGVLAKVDSGAVTTSERERLKELEREVRELKRANEILRKASAYFAQAELDRRGK